LSKNFEVLVMDCTYKTNKYKMPLLTIVGQTSIGTTFHVGFAFLESERPEDYAWVLKHLKDASGALGLPDPDVIVTDRDLALMQAIEEVFPNTSALLCIWHVNKNVLKNCKASFTTEEEWMEFQAAWHQVLFAHTEADCHAAWEAMLTQYSRTNKEDLDYIYDTWLADWSEKICKWKTNKILHFGSNTTQRVEGIHRVLKTLLKFSTGDLMTVVDRIETMLINQRKDFRGRIASAKRKIPFEFRPPVWQDLIGRVTPYALWKMHKQYELVRKITEEQSLTACTGVYTATIDLLCAHQIKARMEEVKGKLGRIPIEDVYYHWRFGKGYGPSTATIETDFAAIATTLAIQLEVESSEESDDVDNRSLPGLDAILLRKATTNKDIRPPPDTDESEEDEYEEIGDHDEALRHINDPRVVKAKGRPTGAKNKKGTMSRAAKAKAKSTERDPSGFEHVEVSIQASRGGSRRHGRGRASRKKPVTATEEVDESEDVHTRYTRGAATRRATTAAIDAAMAALEEETINIDDDDEGGDYEDFNESGFDIDLNMH